VKNVTISLPDEVYRRARIRAAEWDTSISGLVREFLLQIGSPGGTEQKRNLKEVIDSIRAAHPNFRASDRLSREALHDRDALR
jgi:plasmid stability protein